MKKKKILITYGTRPEAIKMAPVIRALRNRIEFQVTVALTAQHRDMLDQVNRLFGITPDFDLDVMTHGQSITDVTIKVLNGMEDVIKKTEPDILLVQGDTTTAFACGLAGFYHKVQVGHIEAGLRTQDKLSPFPEELNRRFVDYLSAFHFAPTQQAKENLEAENIPGLNIAVTGNTSIDALLHTASQPLPADQYKDVTKIIEDKEPFILLTCHRRENFGEPIQRIFKSILKLLAEHNQLRLVYPVHPNPNVKDLAYRTFGLHKNVILLPPQDYSPFIHLMKHCYFILSDSGGIQEEAPSLRKPVLVLRESTERTEAIDAGLAKLVGASEARILEEAGKLLSDHQFYEGMITASNPFGDGRAAEKIADVLALI